MDSEVIENLFSLAKDHGVKFFRYEQDAFEVEFFEPIREMAVPPLSNLINPHEILKDDLESHMPSDEELKFASTPYYDEKSAEKEAEQEGL